METSRGDLNPRNFSNRLPVLRRSHPVECAFLLRQSLLCCFILSLLHFCGVSNSWFKASRTGTPSTSNIILISCFKTEFCFSSVHLVFRRWQWNTTWNLPQLNTRVNMSYTTGWMFKSWQHFLLLFHLQTTVNILFFIFNYEIYDT